MPIQFPSSFRRAIPVFGRQTTSDCRQLQDEFAEFSELVKTQNPDLLLQNIIADPLNPDYEQASKEIEERQRALFETYQEKVANLLTHWYPYKDKADQFRNAVFVEESGRVDIRHNLIFRRFEDFLELPLKVSYFPALIRKVTGEFFMRDNRKIKHMDYLEELEGISSFSGNSIQSMRRLKKIKGNADFGSSDISSLPNLEEMDGDLNLQKTSSLDIVPKLRIITGNLDISRSTVTSFPELEEAGDIHTIYLASDKKRMTFLPKLKKVQSSAILTGTNIADLPSLQTIGGYLALHRTPFGSAPLLRSIGGSLTLQATNVVSFIQSFPSLTVVGGEIQTSNDKLFDEIVALGKAGRVQIGGGVQDTTSKREATI